MSLGWKLVRITFDAVVWVDNVTSRTPVVREVKSRAADTILDRVLGPAEDIDYVSTTAPSSPPPTHP
jgi:hypothetical protein